MGLWTMVSMLSTPHLVPAIDYADLFGGMKGSNDYQKV